MTFNSLVGYKLVSNKLRHKFTIYIYCPLFIELYKYLYKEQICQFKCIYVLAV